MPLQTTNSQPTAPIQYLQEHTNSHSNTIKAKSTVPLPSSTTEPVAITQNHRCNLQE
jgi:hypothetical protein